MTAATIATALDATWPPAATRRLGPWLLREGLGGGKRVCATTLEGTFDPGTIADAETAMRVARERPLFQLRPEDTALDAALAQRGYALIDPVNIYTIKLDAPHHAAPPPMSTFPHWPPLGIAIDLWAEGGIGGARLAVMQRASGPKCAILARNADRASGVAFVAVQDHVAILHALEVTPTQRRKGTAGHILLAAANWARNQGANVLGLAVTAGNAAGNALYASFGMQVVGHYHYRQL